MCAVWVYRQLRRPNNCAADGCGSSSAWLSTACRSCEAGKYDHGGHDHADTVGVADMLDLRQYFDRDISGGCVSASVDDVNSFIHSRIRRVLTSGPTGMASAYEGCSCISRAEGYRDAIHALLEPRLPLLTLLTATGERLVTFVSTIHSLFERTNSLALHGKCSRSLHVYIRVNIKEYGTMQANESACDTSRWRTHQDSHYCHRNTHHPKHPPVPIHATPTIAVRAGESHRLGFDASTTGPKPVRAHHHDRPDSLLESRMGRFDYVLLLVLMLHVLVCDLPAVALVPFFARWRGARRPRCCAPTAPR